MHGDKSAVTFSWSNVQVSGPHSHATDHWTQRSRPLYVDISNLFVSLQFSTLPCHSKRTIHYSLDVSMKVFSWFHHDCLYYSNSQNSKSSIPIRLQTHLYSPYIIQNLQRIDDDSRSYRNVCNMSLIIKSVWKNFYQRLYSFLTQNNAIAKRQMWFSH